MLAGDDAKVDFHACLVLSIASTEKLPSSSVTTKGHRLSHHGTRTVLVQQCRRHKHSYSSNSEPVTMTVSLRKFKGWCHWTESALRHASVNEELSTSLQPLEPKGSPASEFFKVRQVAEAWRCEKDFESQHRRWRHDDSDSAEKWCTMWRFSSCRSMPDRIIPCVYVNVIFRCPDRHSMLSSSDILKVSNSVPEQKRNLLHAAASLDRLMGMYVFTYPSAHQRLYIMAIPVQISTHWQRIRQSRDQPTAASVRLCSHATPRGPHA
jgi:hypothetical protein